MQKIILTIAMIAVSFAIAGCETTQSPTQKYRTAVDGYNLIMRSATVAIDNDQITLEQGEAIEKIRVVARSRIDAARERLRIDPRDPGANSLIEEVLVIIQAIEAVLERPPPPVNKPDPLPVPEI